MRSRRKVVAPVSAIGQVDWLFFTVPLIPPSVNHYKLPRGNGRGYYVSPQAHAFKRAVATIAAGRSVSGKRYRVEIAIHLAPRQKGDLDNCAKVMLDALATAQVIASDARMVELAMSKDRAPSLKLARTDIRVYGLQSERLDEEEAI